MSIHHVLDDLIPYAKIETSYIAIAMPSLQYFTFGFLKLCDG